MRLQQLLELKIMSPELTTWKNEGEYINYGPFNHKLFVKQLGASIASVDKTLLLIHGFPEPSYSFHSIVEGMMKTFDRVILFDIVKLGPKL